MGELTSKTCRGTLAAICVGGVSEMLLESRIIQTGWYKSPLVGSVRITPSGIPGDTQVNTKTHGGPDRAVCFYSKDNYVYWERILGRALPTTAAFGENFTVAGLLEPDVCVGDVLAIGNALLQVTQPRNPCHKIPARYSRPQMAIEMLSSGRTGFFCRVLSEGDVEAGESFYLEHRALGAPSIAEVNRVIFDRSDVGGAQRVLAIEGIADALVARLAARLSLLR